MSEINEEAVYEFQFVQFLIPLISYLRLFFVSSLQLTAAVGEVTIEQPKSHYKSFTRPVEVSNDEFGHVIEVYNFPSDLKTCDLAAAFSPWKNGGFEIKWVDDTHCLAVFSSSLVGE